MADPGPEVNMESADEPKTIINRGGRLEVFYTKGKRDSGTGAFLWILQNF